MKPSQKEESTIRCPKEAYEELLGLDELAIKKEIKRIKRSVRSLKEEVVKEAKKKLKIAPSTWLRLSLAREELDWAIKAYVDSGYEYVKTKGEERKEKMINKLNAIKSLTLHRHMLPFSGGGTWILEFEDDKVEGFHGSINSKGCKYEIINKHFLVEKEEAIENVFDLHIEEWKKKYEEPLVMDGETWEIELEFSDGGKLCYDGHGDYPFSFFRLVEILAKWEREKTYFDLSKTIKRDKKIVRKSSFTKQKSSIKSNIFVEKLAHHISSLRVWWAILLY